MPTGELDTSSGVPLYRQIKDILREEVASRSVDPSRPITEAQLLERFGVSRAPIRQALKELVVEGYVYRKQGRGTFPLMGRRVNRPADVRPGNLYSYLFDSGQHPASTITELGRIIPTDFLREHLDTQPKERLLHFVRMIQVDGEPLVEADVYLRAPDDFAPTVEELTERGAAFELLEQDFGMRLDRAEHEAWATGASHEQAKAFGVRAGSPLLAIDTTFFSTGGVPTGWRRAVHRAENFKYRFVTQG